MKKKSRLFMFVTTVITICAISTNLVAKTYATPLEAIASITEKTQDEILEERNNGKTFGMIASEAGKLEEFHQAMIEMEEARLNVLVENGTITKQQKEDKIALMKENQKNCDGSGMNAANHNCSNVMKNASTNRQGRGHHGQSQKKGAGNRGNGRYLMGNCRSN